MLLPCSGISLQTSSDGGMLSPNPQTLMPEVISGIRFVHEPWLMFINHWAGRVLVLITTLGRIKTYPSQKRIWVISLKKAAFCYIRLVCIRTQLGKDLSGPRLKVGNSFVSVNHWPGCLSVISLGKQAWFCSSNFRTFNSLGSKAEKYTWLPRRFCHLRLKDLWIDSMFLRIICTLSSLVCLESRRTSHKQNSIKEPFLWTHHQWKKFNTSQIWFCVLKDRNLPIFWNL